MAREIERKFKLEKFPYSNEHSDILLNVQDIKQFYLVSSEKGVVRIREQDEEVILTAKGPGLMSREECEVVLPIEGDFIRLLKTLSVGKVVEKKRHTFSDGTIEYTIDVFNGVHDGLVLMEVEFPSEDEAHKYNLPVWGSDAIEVTEDTQYTNSALALK